MLFFLVLVEISVAVGHTKDKTLGICPAMSLQLRKYCPLLEDWTAGMLHTVLTLSNYFMIQHASLRITLHRVYSS